MEDPKLPNDVIVEILRWVPVKPLLKFRCVCKSWRTLISSKEFVRAHLESSKSDRNFTSRRLIMKCGGNFKQCSVNSVLCEAVSEAPDLSCPVETKESVLVVGSCNGLICLSIGLTELILWNPSTRIWKKLPDFGVEIYRRHFDYGFGYDKSSDDYKVVGVFHTKKLPVELIVQVYSMRNDQWKKIKNFTEDGFGMYDPPTFANGKLYWIACPGWTESFWGLYCFDLEKVDDELLKTLSYVNDIGSNAGLGASDGSLVVACNHGTSVDVWIMEKNWTRVATIPHLDDFFKNNFETKLFLPLYVKHGRILLLCSPTLAIFDAKDCTFRYPEITNSVEFVAQTTYLETLVSPLG